MLVATSILVQLVSATHTCSPNDMTFYYNCKELSVMKHVVASHMNIIILLHMSS